jgi:hypothetical protein
MGFRIPPRTLFIVVVAFAVSAQTNPSGGAAASGTDDGTEKELFRVPPLRYVRV